MSGKNILALVGLAGVALLTKKGLDALRMRATVIVTTPSERS